MLLRHALPRAFFAAAILAAGSALTRAPAAFADEPATPEGVPAVQQLTADELEFARSRISDWEHREPADQERIATNLLRIRSLSPDMKARFFDRVKQAKAAGLGSVIGPRVEDFLKLKPDERREMRDGNRIGRAVVATVLQALPASARALLDPAGGPDSLEGPDRTAFSVVLFEQWRRRGMDALVEKPRLDAEPSGEGAERFLALRDEVVAKGGALAPKELRMKFAMACMLDRMRAALRTVPPPEPQQTLETRQAHERVLVSAIRGAFPESHDAIVAEITALAAGGRSAVVAWIRERSQERATAKNLRLLETVIAVERGREFLTGTVRGLAEQFQVALLREMKLPDAEIDELQRADAERAGSLLRRLQEMRRRWGGGQGAPGNRRGPGERRNPPGNGMADDGGQATDAMGK